MSGIEQTLRAAERHLALVDPIMGAQIARHGPCGLAARERDPFDTLCSSIICQQLSSRAADTIQARVTQRVDRGARLHPAGLLTLGIDDLRACGLSNAKARWLRELAQRALDGRLDFAALHALDDEAAIAVLDALPGIGRWTAEMYLIFAMRRLDLFAMDDVGLLRGVHLLYGTPGRKLGERQLARITRRWAPYRSVASWYLWRVADPVTTTWA